MFLSDEFSERTRAHARSEWSSCIFPLTGVAFILGKQVAHVEKYVWAAQSANSHIKTSRGENDSLL